MNTVKQPKPTLYFVSLQAGSEQGRRPLGIYPYVVTVRETNLRFIEIGKTYRESLETRLEKPPEKTTPPLENRILEKRQVVTVSEKLAGGLTWCPNSGQKNGWEPSTNRDSGVHT